MSFFYFIFLGSKMENDVVILPLRCSCPGGVLFNLLVTFNKEGNHMVLLYNLYIVLQSNYSSC